MFHNLTFFRRFKVAAGKKIRQGPKSNLHHLWKIFAEKHNGHANRGSKLSSYEIELQNRVAQIDVALRITNLKIFRETFLSSY